MNPARTARSPVPPAPLQRWPFVLLGLMTMTTVCGPLLIGWVLGGGVRPDWPPDRPVEWVTTIGVSVAVLLLMVACLSVGLINHQIASRAARRTGNGLITTGSEPPSKAVS